MISHLLRKLVPWMRSVLQPTEDYRDASGWHWQLTAEALAFFDGEGPELSRWVAEGRVQLIKENPARTVYRVTLPGGVLYAKRCRAWNARAWAREVLRPAKAQLEFENALRLKALGVPSVIPLGWACRYPGWPGESILLTKEVSNAIPFFQFLESHRLQDPQIRHQLAQQLGRFLGQLHDAGIAHPDPHPGNFLINWDGEIARFTLIDLHDVSIGQPLSWNQARANLVLFNRWFQLRAERSDRHRFWNAYTAQRRTGFSHREARQQIEQVETRTLESNLRLWMGRLARCFGHGRHFRIVRAKAIRGIAVREMTEDILKQLMENPDAVFHKAGVSVLKDSPTSTVACWRVDGYNVILKRFRPRYPWEGWKNIFRRSAAMRSWMVGHSLRDRWLPTPRPLVVLFRVQNGLVRESYLLTEEVPEALTLSEAARRLEVLPFKERRTITQEWIFRIARLIRLLHERGGSHRDLKAANILLQGAAKDLLQARPIFVDLVGAHVGRPISNPRRARELARLNASFIHSRIITQADRLRFLRYYLLANLGKAGQWKWWWKKIAKFTMTKVAKNAKRGRELA